MTPTILLKSLLTLVFMVPFSRALAESAAPNSCLGSKETTEKTLGRLNGLLKCAQMGLSTKCIEFMPEGDEKFGRVLTSAGFNTAANRMAAASEIKTASSASTLKYESSDFIAKKSLESLDSYNKETLDLMNQYHKAWLENSSNTAKLKEINSQLEARGLRLVRGGGIFTMWEFPKKDKLMGDALQELFLYKNTPPRPLATHQLKAMIAGIPIQNGASDARQKALTIHHKMQDQNVDNETIRDSINKLMQAMTEGQTPEVKAKQMALLEAKFKGTPSLTLYFKKGTDSMASFSGAAKGAGGKALGKFASKALPLGFLAGPAYEAANCAGEKNISVNACLGKILDTSVDELTFFITPTGCSERYSKYEKIDEKCNRQKTWNPGSMGFITDENLSSEDRFNELVSYPQFCQTIRDLYRKSFPPTMQSSCGKDKTLTINQNAKSYKFAYTENGLISKMDDRDSDDDSKRQKNYTTMSWNSDGGAIGSIIKHNDRTITPIFPPPRGRGSGANSKDLFDLQLGMTGPFLTALEKAQECLGHTAGETSDSSSNTAQ